MAEIIMGIDHGNGNMKGVHVNFPCGLVRYTSEPGRFMNEDILEYNGVYYTLSETRMPFKADKTVDEDYFILTLFSLALEAKERGITLSGKDIVLGVGLPPADFGQQAPGFKKYFMEHSKHGISFRFNGKPINCYLKDVLVSPQNFAAVMCYKASLFRQYRTVNCIDIGDGTVDLLVIRKGQPDLSVRVSDRSGMAILRSEISNSIQQNYGIHLESSDVEQVLMQEATILDEKVVREIQKMAGDWMQRIINKLHAYVPDFRTNPAVFLGGGSLLLKQQIEKSSDFKYIEFIEDIRANAVGYEKMTALHIQKRQGAQVFLMVSCQRTVDIHARITHRQTNRLRQVRFRILILSALQEQHTSRRPCIRIIAVHLDGLVRIVHGLQRILLLQRHLRTHQVRIRITRRDTNQRIQIRTCLRIFLLVHPAQS